MKKRFILAVAFLLIALTMAGCGQKTKGHMTLNAAGVDIETYSEGFKKYFDLDAVDAAGFAQGQFEAADGARYVVLAAQGPEGLDGLEPVEAAFLIGLYDDGQAVQVRILYTVGAEREPHRLQRQLAQRCVHGGKNADLYAEGNGIRRQKGGADRGDAV